MHRFHLVKKTPDARIRWKKVLAAGYARSKIVGTGRSETLGRLFDMVTMNGPIPEIATERDDQAS